MVTDRPLIQRTDIYIFSSALDEHVYSFKIVRKYGMLYDCHITKMYHSIATNACAATMPNTCTNTQMTTKKLCTTHVATCFIVVAKHLQAFIYYLALFTALPRKYCLVLKLRTASSDVSQRSVIPFPLKYDFVYY